MAMSPFFSETLLENVKDGDWEAAYDCARRAGAVLLCQVIDDRFSWSEADAGVSFYQAMQSETHYPGKVLMRCIRGY